MDIMEISRMKQDFKYNLDMMLKDLANVREPRKMPNQDVMDICEDLADRKDMESPHAEEDISRLYDDMVFYDDVNGGNMLDKQEVINARRLGIKLFRKWECTARCPDPR